MDQNNNNSNHIPSPQEILDLAAKGEAFDRSMLGIDTPRSSDGLQAFNEGFDFLQHGNDDMKPLND